MRTWMKLVIGILITVPLPVSYTHLDVYKRQDREILEALLGIVRASRRTRSAKKEEILFVGHGQ